VENVNVSVSLLGKNRTKGQGLRPTLTEGKQGQRIAVKSLALAFLVVVEVKHTEG